MISRLPRFSAAKSALFLSLYALPNRCSRSFCLGGKALAALGATTINDGTTILGCHAGTETVITGAANAAWLIRETHHLLLNIKRVANSKFRKLDVKLIRF